MISYFILKKTDLTNEMLSLSLNSGNPFDLRCSTCGNFVILKFCCHDIPLDLFKLDYSPMTKEEITEYISLNDIFGEVIDD